MRSVTRNPEPIKVRAILFDFDGTLFHTVPMIVDSFRHVYDLFHMPQPSEEEIIATIGLPLESVFQPYGEELSRAMLEAYTRHNVPLVRTHVGIYLGIGPMLDQLRAMGFPLGIVSAKRLKSLTPTLETFEMESYFSCIVTKDDTEKHKPDPEPLLMGMRKLGYTDPADVLYVGDAIYDIQAAANGGFPSVAVSWGAAGSKALEAENPTALISRAADLPEIVQRKL